MARAYWTPRSTACVVPVAVGSVGLEVVGVVRVHRVVGQLVEHAEAALRLVGQDERNGRLAVERPFVKHLPQVRLVTRGARVVDAQNRGA